MACLGEDVVVTGMAGRFPECNSVAEFWSALEEGKDLVMPDNCRWDLGSNDAPTSTGRIPHLDRMDFDFFGLKSSQVDVMDTQARLLLELTYEAMFDAGISPTTLRGSKTGVFVGACFNDMEIYVATHPQMMDNTWAMFGSFRAFLANRISYMYDLTGPSQVVDSACSSSMYALESAVNSIRHGGCTAAIVAGTNVMLNPLSSQGLHVVGATSHDGKCRSFDAAANGYARSEAVVVLLLQPASQAKRDYGTIVTVATNCDGFKPKNMAFPSIHLQGRLMESSYREAGVPLDRVDYLECHGTGTPVGDPVELGAIARVFCPRRKAPLLVGSVKSNMGHSEGASGLCAIVKVLLAMKYSKIPANLHFKTPNSKIPALVDGSLQVVTKHLPLTGDFVGVNSFGVGGANAHVIIRRPGNQAAVRSNARHATLPWVVGISGRTEQAVQLIMDQVKLDPDNFDTIALLHAFFSSNIPKHLYRGAIVVSPDGTNITEIVQECCVDKPRPIWYVVSGFGGQWPTMCRHLLTIPTFRATIAECNDALKPYNVDIFDILNDPDEEAIHRFVNGFVAWVAIQVALVDLLTLIGVKPDGIIGHSIGEIASAYADGCLTAKQAALVAYHRGTVFSKPEFKGGAMAAVGMSAEEVEKLLSPGVEVGCDNGRSNVTLSGPENELRAFVETLRQRDVFVKDVNVNGVAFHSRQIAAGASMLKTLLKKVIPDPKPRSERWISTSVDSDSDLDKLCSAEYLVNNQMSRVRFREACAEIPADALVVEIAPTTMLEAVLKDMLPVTVKCVALLRRKEADVQSLAKAIGTLYACGAQPDLSKLYPGFSFPVAATTPLLSSLVGWDHSMKLAVPCFTDKSLQHKQSYRYTVDLSREEDAWYAGHAVDGRVVFPATGYLVLVWKTMASLLSVKYEQLSVKFEDVRFLQATVLPPSGEVEFCVQLLGSGRTQFKVTESDRLICSGFVTSEKLSAISQPSSTTTTTTTTSSKATDVDATLSQDRVGLVLEQLDVYKDLLLRGHDYQGGFRSISEVHLSEDRAVVLFSGNWVMFLDGMLQMLLFLKSGSPRLVVLPTRVRQVTIDPSLLHNQNGPVHVSLDPSLKTTSCRGVTVIDVSTAIVERRPDLARPLLEHMTFTPYHSLGHVTLNTALESGFMVIGENLPFSEAEMHVALFCNDDEMTSDITDMLRNVPFNPIKVTHVTADDNENLEATLRKSDVKLAKDVTDCQVAITRHIDEKISKAIKKDGYVMLLSKTSCEVVDGFTVLSSATVSTGENLVLCVKRQDNTTVVEDVDKEVAADVVASKLSVVRLDKEDGFDWLSELQKIYQENDGDILLVSEGQDNSGVVGLVNCLKMERMHRKIRCIFIQDQSAPKFSLTEPFFAKQLSLGLTMNVYKHASWGSYRHLQLADTPQILSENAYVNTTLTGDLSSLCWLAGRPLQKPPAESNSVLCRVYFSALNFHDIKLASGRLALDSLPDHLANQDCVLGLEFSGRDCTGRRVMGLVEARGMATTVLASSVWQVPDHWSLEQAATVPVVYCTVYYALVMRGRMRRGESVLIHSGSGGVGQAAIMLALHAGCTVYTTVGSEEKRAFLKERFPQLDDAHIGNSRSTSFEQLVMRATQGRGVDLVLNSLSDDKLLASVRCLAQHGRFLELGQFDLEADHPLGMSVFLKNVSYHGIRLDQLFGPAGYEDFMQIVSLVQEGINSGVVRPLNYTTFATDQVAQAFRYMSAGKHIGKVLVKVCEEEKNCDGRCLVVPPSPHSIPAVPRYYVPHGSVCIVTGGLGGFGLELASWLVLRGARHLVLCSRTGDVSRGYKALCMRRLEAAGAVVHVSTQDITTRRGVEGVVWEAEKLGQVSAIFHLAVVLSDNILQNQSVDSFRRVWNVKMSATAHLDLVSRSRCSYLEQFVVFSSAASGRGNPGQSNYCMASSAAERVVESRHAAGYPATAIQWGPIGEVGLAADLDNLAAAWGVHHQSVRSCLAAMDTLLTCGHPVVASMVVSKLGMADAAGGGDAMLKAMANSLGVKDLTALPPDTKLTDLGMDSLMQVEVRMALERYRGITLSPEEMRQLTVGVLLDLARNHSDKHTAAVDKTEPLGYQSMKMETQSLMMELIQVDTSRSLKMPDNTVVCLESAGAGLPPVFMLHPIDGCCASLRGLASHIRRRVYALQFTDQAPQTDVPDLAAFYVKHVREKQSEGPYVLIGYSFGAMVASEMALQMELQGLTVTLCILDGFPQYRHMFKDDHDWEMEILLNSAKPIVGKADMEEMRRMLNSAADWKSRLDLFMQLQSMVVSKKEVASAVRASKREDAPAVGASKREDAPTVSGSEREDASVVGASKREDSPTVSASEREDAPAANASERDGIRSWLWRLDMLVKHSVRADCVKLRIDVLVIAAQRGVLYKERVDESYGFREICQGKVDVINVDGGHLSFLHKKHHQITVAGHINTFLQQQQQQQQQKQQ